jgi:hypothetical protein
MDAVRAIIADDRRQNGLIKYYEQVPSNPTRNYSDGGSSENPQAFPTRVAGTRHWIQLSVAAIRSFEDAARVRISNSRYSG